jgi:hypothetical protein
MATVASQSFYLQPDKTSKRRLIVIHTVLQFHLGTTEPFNGTRQLVKKIRPRGTN